MTVDAAPPSPQSSAAAPIVDLGLAPAYRRAAEEGSQALILQVNSKGTVVDDARVEGLLEDIIDSGLTLHYLIRNLRVRQPASIEARMTRRISATGPPARSGLKPRSRISSAAATESSRTLALVM